MLTTYPLDAPAKRAIDPYFALPGEAVDGADLRVNATGGMKMISSMYNAGGIPFPESMTFVIGNEGLTYATYRHLCGSAGAFGGGFRISIGPAGTLEVLENGGTDIVALGTVPVTAKILRIDYVPATRTFSAYADHELIGSGVRTPTDPLLPIIYVCGAWAGGESPINCDVNRIRFANFIPTTDEAEGAAKGESRGRLAQRAGTVVNGVFDGTHGPGTTGGFTSGAGGFMLSATDRHIPTGNEVVVRWNSTAAGPTLHLVPEAGGGYLSNAAVSVIGANEAVLTSTGEAGAFVFDALAAGTISGFTAEYRGTVASCAPENCTSLNRWLDNSGNNYHLLPVGGAKALNPQVPHWRKYAFAVDTVTPAFGGSGLLPGFAGSKTGTGVAQVTFTNFGFDYALAANTHLQRKVGATGFCTSQMLGPGTAEFKFYDIAGTPADAYGNGEIEIFE